MCVASFLPIDDGRRFSVCAKVTALASVAVDVARKLSSQRGRLSPALAKMPRTTLLKASLKHTPGMLVGFGAKGTRISPSALGHEEIVEVELPPEALLFNPPPDQYKEPVHILSTRHPSSMRRPEASSKRARTGADEGTEGPCLDIDPHNEGAYPADQELGEVDVSNGMDQCGVSHGPTPARELTGYCTQVPNSGRRRPKRRGRRGLRGRPRSRPSR